MSGLKLKTKETSNNETQRSNWANIEVETKDGFKKIASFHDGDKATSTQKEVLSYLLEGGDLSDLTIKVRLVKAEDVRKGVELVINK